MNFDKIEFIQRQQQQQKGPTTLFVLPKPTTTTKRSLELTQQTANDYVTFLNQHGFNVVGNAVSSVSILINFN